jgi:hypothetical protein
MQNMIVIIVWREYNCTLMGINFRETIEIFIGENEMPTPIWKRKIVRGYRHQMLCRRCGERIIHQTREEL